MAGAKSIGTVGRGGGGRSWQPLTLRLTPRGTRRPRLLATRSSRISASTASCRAGLARGGKGREHGQLAPDYPHRVQEREPVRVLVGPECRLVHQPAHREVRQQQAPELLPHQLGVLLRSTTRAPRSCVFSSASAPSISHRSWYRAASSAAGAAAGSRIVVTSRESGSASAIPSSRSSTTRTRTPSVRCRRSFSPG